MIAGKRENYIDSRNIKHIIQEYGHNEVKPTLGGMTVAFSPDEVHIDGKKWDGYDDVGLGDPIEFAKQWIEAQNKLMNDANRT